jgi:hypothetical protein
MFTKFRMENLKRTDRSVDLSVNLSILGKWISVEWIHLALKSGHWHGNEHSSSIKGGQFLDY